VSAAKSHGFRKTTLHCIHKMGLMLKQIEDKMGPWMLLHLCTLYPCLMGEMQTDLGIHRKIEFQLGLSSLNKDSCLISWYCTHRRWIALDHPASTYLWKFSNNLTSPTIVTGYTCTPRLKSIQCVDLSFGYTGIRARHVTMSIHISVHVWNHLAGTNSK
jgi:hypothetical protein